jgi:hypothetical protein
MWPSSMHKAGVFKRMEKRYLRVLKLQFSYMARFSIDAHIQFIA